MTAVPHSWFTTYTECNNFKLTLLKFWILYLHILSLLGLKLSSVSSSQSQGPWVSVLHLMQPEGNHLFLLLALDPSIATEAVLGPSTACTCSVPPAAPCRAIPYSQEQEKLVRCKKEPTRILCCPAFCTWSLLLVMGIAPGKNVHWRKAPTRKANK